MRGGNKGGEREERENVDSENRPRGRGKLSFDVFAFCGPSKLSVSITVMEPVEYLGKKAGDGCKRMRCTDEAG